MNKAFTLIEFLIVVGIIAILAAAIVVAISPGEQLASARDSTRDNHLHSLHTSLTAYRVSEGTYPDTVEVMQEICNTNDEGVSDPNDCGDHDLVDLSMLGLPRIPVDPQGGDHEYGTGYYVATGSIRLHAPNAETRIVSVNNGWAHNGLVGWWRLDDGEGVEARDSSGFNNDATLQGSPEWVATGPLGEWSLEFDGDGDYLNVPMSQQTTNELTWAAWLRPETDDNRIFLGAWPVASAIYYFRLVVVGDDHRLSLSIRTEEAGQRHLWGGNVPMQTWSHVAGTYDGETMRIFIDEEEVNTRMLDGETLSPWGVGSIARWTSGSPLYYTGVIDDVRAYNRALTPDEIQRLYNLGAGE